MLHKIKEINILLLLKIVARIIGINFNKNCCDNR